MKKNRYIEEGPSVRQLTFYVGVGMIVLITIGQVMRKVAPHLILYLD